MDSRGGTTFLNPAFLACHGAIGPSSPLRLAADPLNPGTGICSRVSRLGALPTPVTPNSEPFRTPFNRGINRPLTREPRS